MTTLKKHNEVPLFDERWTKVRRLNIENLCQSYPGIENDPQIGELLTWYKEQLAKTLPLIRDPSPITNETEWTTDVNDAGQLEALYRFDGNFYQYIGVKVTRKIITADGQEINRTHTQPAQQMLESDMTFELFGEERTLPVNGILVVFKDEHKNTLVGFGQETMSGNINQLNLKLTAQVSAGKAAMWMAETNPEKRKTIDLTLTALMKNLKIEKPTDLLSLPGPVLLAPTGDPNLTIKDNILKVVTIHSSDPLYTTLTDGGENKWLSPKQIRAAGQLGVINEHLLASLTLVNDDELLSQEFKN